MKLKLLILGLVSSLGLLLAAMPASAQFNPLCPNKATSGTCPCAKGSPSASSPACQQNSGQNGKTTDPAIDTIKTAANLLAVIGGVAAVIVIIISGFMFVTAGGATPGQRSSDPNRVKNARAALLGAIIGLIVIALAWTIVTFVTDNFVKT